MPLTALQEKQIQETHDAITKLTPMIQDHHITLYGNGQPGLVKDHLTFKTKITTALSVVSVILGLAIAIMRWLK